jgi:hypothetical protein
MRGRDGRGEGTIISWAADDEDVPSGRRRVDTVYWCINAWLAFDTWTGDSDISL